MFRSNVLLQTKNGPLDFQPREPFHPLFGAMPKTAQMIEFQITKEYLGEDTHLVYLGSLFSEVLNADTYARGAGSTVARVIDGSLQGQTETGMAGVSNIGSDSNWTGSQFNQANWYAFGRLAWDHSLSPASIADDRFTQTQAFLAIKEREAVVAERGSRILSDILTSAIIGRRGAAGAPAELLHGRPMSARRAQTAMRRDTVTAQ